MIKIAICDDDANITGSIERNIQKISTENKYEVETEVWQSPSKMCSDFKYWGKPDLLFLDIEFTDTSGMRVARYLRNELNDCYTSIVFISGKSEYAVDLCRMEPFDFLIKPISIERIGNVLSAYIRKYERDNEVFEFSSKRIYYRTYYKEIMLFSSNNKKITITFYDHSQIDFIGKLKDVKKVAPHNFFLVNQSCLVNYDYIASCRYENILLRTGEVIEISRNKRKEVRAMLAARRWDK